MSSDYNHQFHSSRSRILTNTMYGRLELINYNGQGNKQIQIKYYMDNSKIHTVSMHGFLDLETIQKCVVGVPMIIPDIDRLKNMIECLKNSKVDVHEAICN